MNVCKMSTDWMIAVKDSDGNYGDWQTLYIPAHTTKVEHQNVAGADSGRAEDGLMFIDWVRRDMFKVYLKWPAMTRSELSYTLRLLQGKEFRMTFPNITLTRSDLHTYTDTEGVTKPYIEAYASNCSYEFYNQNYLGSAEDLYTEIAIDAIEI